MYSKHLALHLQLIITAKIKLKMNCHPSQGHTEVGFQGFPETLLDFTHYLTHQEIF